MLGIRLNSPQGLGILSGVTLILALNLFIYLRVYEGPSVFRLPSFSPPSPTSIEVEMETADSLGSVEYINGLATLIPNREGKIELGSHPILELIERGRQKHREIENLRKRVKTLNDAVEDYRAMHGMMPPQGFEAWFEFTQTHGTTHVPSLLPESHLSVLPYLSLPPQILRERAVALQKDDGVFGMLFYPEGKTDAQADLDLGDERDKKFVGVRNADFMVNYMSPRWDYPDLLEAVIPLIPPPQNPSEPLQLTICVRDGACRLTDGRVLARSRELAREKQVWNMEELEQAENSVGMNRGWGQTCNPPVQPPKEVLPLSSSKSFISDLVESMDYCVHPELLHMNGEMIMEEEHLVRPLAPMMAVSRFLHGSDMLGTPTRAVKDHGDEISWEEKTVSKAVWRGTLTGIYHRNRWDWRASQRHRLSHLASNMTDEVVGVLMENQGPGWEGKVGEGRWTVGELVDSWLDVGVIKEDIHNICGPGPTDDACRLDGGHQYEECPHYESACDEMQEEYEWVKKMNLEESLPYKYRIDVDGYGWSSRWRKVLSTDSVVLKSTIYPEWWTAQSIPWFHYVPLKYDYSDLWDIMFFFDGAPDGSSLGRDDLARTIAGNAKKFAETELRWVEMQSYMLLFLLEYRRAWSDDRQAATMSDS